jgi:dihydroxy-acid dehydratase
LIRILKGNLAPGGAVAKITGKEGLSFTGKARVFDTEDTFVAAVESGSIKKGEKTVVILRYLGPKGGPGQCHAFFLSLFRKSLLCLLTT